MRKGFTRKPQGDEPATQSKNYITPGGLRRLKDEQRFLLTRERPAVTEVVAWAASNGDRSENADYQYGKRRLRQIDGRIRFLTKQIESAEVVDPETSRAGQAATTGAPRRGATGRGRGCRGRRRSLPDAMSGTGHFSAALARHVALGCVFFLSACKYALCHYTFIRIVCGIYLNCFCMLYVVRWSYFYLVCK